MVHRGPANPERSFGISVGIVLLLIAAYQWWRGGLVAAQIFAVIGAPLLVLGVIYPTLLKWPSALWWKVAAVLGFINAQVILTILFALVLTPIALLWRLLGRDPLTRRRQSWPGWSPHPARYKDPNHFKRMY